MLKDRTAERDSVSCCLKGRVGLFDRCRALEAADPFVEVWALPAHDVDADLL